MTAVRLMAQAVGKANIVARENAAYGISRAGTRCNPIQTNSERLPEIRAAITTRAEAGDRVALMMRAADALRQEFGLRAKESLLSSKVIERDGVRYMSVEGAKGGRPREREVRILGLEDTGDRQAVAEELGHGRESVTAHYAS